MNESIIQWNMRGFVGHLEGLRRIIAEYRPMCLCLQETKLRPGNPPRIPGFNVYSQEVQPAHGGRAHGGVAVCIRNNIQCKQISLNTNLQAVAVRLHVPLQVTIVSIYLPDIYWRKSELENLLSQLPAPLVLLGDFNSHNSLWGSTTDDARGRALEEIIDNANLMILNNGSPTHLNEHSGVFSALDLSLATPSVASILEWSTLEELYHSDHYPILLTTPITRSSYRMRKRYDTRRADWPAYAAAVVTPPITGNVNTDSKNFADAIIRATQNTIPLIGGKISRPPVPWWTAECKMANKAKKKAFNRLKRYPTEENLITFKICRAKERKLIRTSKKETLTSYVSTITTSSPLREVWNKIKTFSGARRFPQIPTFEINGVVITETEEVIKCLAEHYALVSGTQAFSDEFHRKKEDAEQNPLDFDTDIQEVYNSPLTITELENALKKTRESTPGGDDISYGMIKNLNRAAKEQLLCLYNQIWESSQYPKSWREAG